MNIDRLVHAAQHLEAVSRWPWCIRDDAAMLPSFEKGVDLVVRWRDISVEIHVPQSCNTNEVVLSAMSALSAVATASTPLPNHPIILKVRFSQLVAS